MICPEMWNSPSMLALKTKWSLPASGYNPEICTLVKKLGCQELEVVTKFPVCWDLVSWNWQYEVSWAKFALVGMLNCWLP